MDDKILQGISRAAHASTLGIVEITTSRFKSIPKAEQAVLSGIAAALAQVLWESRTPGFTVAQVTEAWTKLGALFIEQSAKNEEARRTDAG